MPGAEGSQSTGLVPWYPHHHKENHISLVCFPTGNLNQQGDSTIRKAVKVAAVSVYADPQSQHC